METITVKVTKASQKLFFGMEAINKETEFYSDGNPCDQ